MHHAPMRIRTKGLGDSAKLCRRSGELPVLRACAWLLSLLGATAGPMLAAAAPASSAATQLPPRSVRVELARGAALLRRQMARLPEGSGVVLEHAPDRLLLRIPASLLFAPDAITLRADHDSATIVSLIAQPLMRRPHLAAEVLVYTDSIGGSSFNDPASSARAQAVAAALLAHGVPETRVEARGAGATAALASNDSAAGRMRNRRVEIAFEYAKTLKPAPAAGHAGG
jgi:outer membrane protein OmpA-like peptidoglycan-associated protein